MKPILLVVSTIAAFAALIAIAEFETRDKETQHLVPHPEGDLLAVYFAHADHVDESCISCHHNYVDDTGMGMCFDCHKTDPEVKDIIEEQFHELCMGCHLEEQTKGSEHGPTRQCIECHVPDEKP